MAGSRAVSFLKSFWEAINTPIYQGLSSDTGPLRKLPSKSRKRVMRLGTAIILGACVGVIGRVSVGPMIENQYAEYVIAKQLQEQSPALSVLADGFPMEFARVTRTVQMSLERDLSPWKVQEEMEAVLSEVRHDLYPYLDTASDEALKDLISATADVFGEIIEVKAFAACKKMVVTPEKGTSGLLNELIKDSLEQQSIMMFKAVAEGQGKRAWGAPSIDDWHRVEKELESQGVRMSFPIAIQNGSSPLSDEALCRQSYRFLKSVAVIESEEAKMVRRDIAMSMGGGRPLAYTYPYDVEL